MSLLDKLFYPKKCLKNTNASKNERNPSHFTAEQVRILLFKECEWRGRKLLFDSVAPESCQYKNSCTSNNNNVVNEDALADKKLKKISNEKNNNNFYNDIGRLSEMVFGTVAMTYRGPSLKVHAIKVPACVMCTQVFPALEYISYKQRLSDEGFVTTEDSNSSNSSLRTLFSDGSSTNLSTASLGQGLRKISTCSSNGSNWELDVPVQFGSSQSLDSNGSSGFGSLSSLRRKWLRTISTSLNRADSDDLFGMQHCIDGGTIDGQDKHVRRHKTSLGLAMLIQLNEGCEKEMEARLLERAALLEGIIDWLRYFSIESSKHSGSHSRCSFSSRMHRASSYCALWLWRLLMEHEKTPTPLLWHNVLLSPNVSYEEKIDKLYFSLDRMSQLLNTIDTKTTNFFLSTLVTAVLTHHLGWVHSVLNPREKHLIESVGKNYPCNPLWSQLGDLYGALGKPLRLVHTLIVGDSEKADLINEVLKFVSYFLRCGIIRKRQERRCPLQTDVLEAIVLLEQVKRKNPSMFEAKPKSTRSVQSTAKKTENNTHLTVTKAPDKCAALLKSKMKRTKTLQKSLDKYAESPDKEELEDDLKKKQLISATSKEDKDDVSKVKIIVNDVPFRDYETKNLPFMDVEKKLDERDLDEMFFETKVASFHCTTETNFVKRKLPSVGLDETDSTLFLDRDQENKQSQVLFTLGGEEKPARSPYTCNCQNSFVFTRVPSTSAQLPEGVLRKIIQRNFPESSKSIQSGSTSSIDKTGGFCLKCCGNGYSTPQNNETAKLLLETPTNATEVLRSCSSSIGNRGSRVCRSNSLEALMEASNVVELPMPRSKKTTKPETNEKAGFTDTLIQTNVIKMDANNADNELCNMQYTWGLAMQGLVKKSKSKRKDNKNNEDDNDWLQIAKEEIEVESRFSVIDQPISEALCILADLDTWQVGIISSNSSLKPPLPVGMSRIIATMLEAFNYVWEKYHSPLHCVNVLENKLREMLLQGEALAELLMEMDLCEAGIANVSDALDLDAADIPLLLAVATTHSPQVAQRFGLSLA